MKNNEKKLFILSIVFISFNLRAALTGVGPLISMIQEDLHLSSGIAGLITTIPLLAFAAISPLVGKAAEKLGEGRTILFAYLTLALGVCVRSYLGTAGLFLGTILAGIGIAVGNVLIPAIIKNHYPERVGTMTSIYTASMGIFASISAAISVPVAATVGWKNSMAVWILLAVIAIFFWLPFRKMKIQRDEAHGAKIKLLSSPVAKWVAVFMGFQSLFFYCFVAWLPTILSAKGFDTASAGYWFSAYQLLGIPASFITPIVASRSRDQRPVVVATISFYLLGMILITGFHARVLVIIGVILCGFCAGCSISLAMLLINMRTRSAATAAQLSGMSQSIGYLIAATGPFLLGFVFDFTQNWTITLIILILLLSVLFVAGWNAGKDRYVE